MPQTIFKGVTVSDQQILQAMKAFDAQWPHDSNEYDSWLEKKSYKYAVRRGRRLYPVGPKKSCDALAVRQAKPSSSPSLALPGRVRSNADAITATASETVPHEPPGRCSLHIATLPDQHKKWATRLRTPNNTRISNFPEHRQSQ